MKRLSIAIAMLFALWGCSKETIELYSGKSLLYFDYSIHTSNKRNPTRIDTTLFTFSLSNTGLTDSIYNMQISLMGRQSAHDRPFTIQVVDSTTTAVAGVHYEALKDVYVMPANQSVVYIPVRFYRTKEMAQHQYQLQMKLLPNADFDTTLTQPADKMTVATATYTIYIDDQIARPVRWLDVYLGTFSRRKMLLICEQLKMTPNDFVTIAVAEVTYIGKAMQRYLNQQKAAGNIIYEEDGTEMIMGDASL